MMSSSSSTNVSSSSSTSGSDNESKTNLLLGTSSSDLFPGPHAEDFAKDLSCPFCLEWFKGPVILPCGHNFCRSCIEDVWGKEQARLCPECRAECPDGQCIRNIVLEKLVEKIKGFHVGKCQHKCSTHKEPLKLFWKTDGKLACFLCRDAQSPEDQASQFLLLPDAVQLYVEKLVSTRTQLEATVQQLAMLKTAQQQKISCHKKNKFHLQQHISLEFLKLHQFLHEREKRLMKELQQEGKALLLEMEENLNKLQEKWQQAKEMVLCIQSQLYQHTSINFLTGIKAFVERLEQKAATLSVGELVSRKLSMGQFKGPIQYTTWKEMKSCLRPGLSLVTLDPKTAHPNLVLSDDLSCVKHDDIKQTLPDTPERFDSSVAVLGSQGFTSGKHYWEVEVKNKTKWTLGVVKESINRKGNITLSPKNGFWLIRLRDSNKFKALDIPARGLTLHTGLSKIGVYLDYEGRQVSFYDANKMSHIYTFMDTFTETIYPYFCPCLNDSHENSEPLKIFFSNI